MFYPVNPSGQSFGTIPSVQQVCWKRVHLKLQAKNNCSMHPSRPPAMSSCRGPSFSFTSLSAKYRASCRLWGLSDLKAQEENSSSSNLHQLNPRSSVIHMNSGPERLEGSWVLHASVLHSTESRQTTIMTSRKSLRDVQLQ